LEWLQHKGLALPFFFPQSHLTYTGLIVRFDINSL